MNKKTSIIVGVAIALIGAALPFVTLQPKSEPPAESVSTTTDQAEPAPNPDTMSPQPGGYVDYEEGIIANTEGTAILFFHAPWCSQCRAAEQSIEASGVPNGVTIIKVDYDSRQDLRQQYGVTIQTTFVKVNQAGEKLDSFVAYDDPTIDAVLGELTQ